MKAKTKAPIVRYIALLKKSWLSINSSNNPWAPLSKYIFLCFNLAFKIYLIQLTFQQVFNCGTILFIIPFFYNLKRAFPHFFYIIFFVRQHQHFVEKIFCIPRLKCVPVYSFAYEVGGSTTTITYQ